MRQERPATPWELHCPWCPYYIVVFPRGAHGGDPGSGVEAAQDMEDHARVIHTKTWAEFLAARPF